MLVVSEDGVAEVRWGIIGAGRVCHDFVQALKSVAGAKVRTLTFNGYSTPT